MDNIPKGLAERLARNLPDKLPENLPSPSAMESLAKQFEKHAKDMENSKQSREQAEKWREQAQRLLESASPQQREQLEKLARQIGNSHEANGRDKDGPPPAGTGQLPGNRPDQAANSTDEGDSGTPPGQSPGRGDPEGSVAPGNRGPRLATDRSTTEAWKGQTDLVDARRTEPGSREQTIAEWYNPKGGPGSGVDHSKSSIASQAFQNAAKGAEHAIEQQVVPNQYSDFVRRVFGRYVERTKLQGQPSRPAIENAPDAKPTPTNPRP